MHPERQPGKEVEREKVKKVEMKKRDKKGKVHNRTITNTDSRQV